MIKSEFELEILKCKKMSFETWTEEQISSLFEGVNLIRPSRNSSMFKYVSLRTNTSWDYFERMLNSSELMGATAKSLNDPFELSPHIFDDLRPSTIALAHEDRLLSERLNGSKIDKTEKYGDIDSFRSDAHAFLEKIVKYSRIISFCSRSNSPLLWSHYANSYQGACVHFFANAFNFRRDLISSVRYSSHRPTVPLSLALALSVRSASRTYNHRSGGEEEVNKYYFFTKASDWSYEEEIRIVYNVNNMSSYKFNPEGLASIIVGPQMSEKDEDRLRNLVNKSPLAHIPIKKARLSQNSFSVEIDDK